MINTLPNWFSPKTFAAQYVTSKSKSGTSRQYIYQLIQKEMNEPNSTDIDVLVVDGVLFCKYRIGKAKADRAKITV